MPRNSGPPWPRSVTRKGSYLPRTCGDVPDNLVTAVLLEHPHSARSIKQYWAELRDWALSTDMVSILITLMVQGRDKASKEEAIFVAEERPPHLTTAGPRCWWTGGSKATTSSSCYKLFPRIFHPDPPLARAWRRFLTGKKFARGQYIQLSLTGYLAQCAEFSLNSEGIAPRPTQRSWWAYKP